MSRFATIDQVDVTGKRVLLRADLNVPMKDGKVQDATRIERLAPTIAELADRGARVIVMSHFGRPKGKPDVKESLKPLVPALQAALGKRPVHFVGDCIGPWAERSAAALKPGEILLLENTRFHKGEEANDPEFAKALARLGDLYVNDAFSVAHRAHASTEGVAHLLPAYAGRLMQAELEALNRALDAPQRPVAAIVGGAKVSTKLDLLQHLIARVDVLAIGGAMANTLLLAQGIGVGTSLAEHDMIDTAKAFLATAKAANKPVILPVDAVVASALKSGVPTATVATDQVPPDQMILDIGPKTVAAIEAKLGDCRTVVWNGPVGAFETPPFDLGTVEIARSVARLTKSGTLVSIAGGGDTVAALAAAGVTDDLTYVSAAGGAFLEWLEGRVLPGVAALERR
ncbi:MAG TPA: phosphoglycerate kinase [Stellaceae bacterium]